MFRYFIYLAYDGTNYHGWQVQPNGTSVQETLTRALITFLRDDAIEVIRFGESYRMHMLASMQLTVLINTILLPVRTLLSDIMHGECFNRWILRK